MMSHHKWLNIGLIITVFYCFLFQCNTLEAQTSKKAKKKKEVSFIKKGWDDVTTRNNYYFNAKRIYDEMLKNHERTAVINYNDTLPYYFHDISPDLSGNAAQLQQIIIKTGVTLQRHDYSRWKDDCYTLLGKSYFLKGKMDSALVNFQYVSTALRGKFNDTKVAISQKDILKAKVDKQKELDRLAKDKKKEIEAKDKAKKEETAKAAEDKKKRMEDVAKEKEKELQRKIKAKEKMLKQKAKGKYKPPAPSAAKPTTPASKPGSAPKKKKKSAGDILDKISDGVSLEIGGKSGSQSEVNKAEQKIKALQYTKEKLESANVEDSLTQKQKETLHKLTLWEKIKHLRSRPDALVWMTKTLIKQRNYADAESIVEYSKTLVKLRAKQRKDIHLVRSYYFYNTGQQKLAIEALSEAIPFIKKKKEKNYYNFLLAQLSSSENPQGAYDIYYELYKKGKDEILSYNALEKMYQFADAGKAGTGDMPEILKAYNKFSKSKIVGDKALYTLATISLKNQDTTKAVEQLNKALSYGFSTPDQKGKALAKLGDIAYEKMIFKDAYVLYDSASAMISADTAQKVWLTAKAKVLKEIVGQQDLAFQQDSLIYLSTLSREDLADYIKAQNKIDKKEKRKAAARTGDDATFVSQGLGNNSNFNASQDQFTAKGQWYFYNIDMRTRGFNEFKQQWGERPYINNWRRAEAIQQNTLGITDLVKQNTDTTIPPPTNIQFKIPSTEEEFEKSYEILAQSYIKRANDFHNGLDNKKAAFIYLDSLINRFPEHKLTPEAYYTKMLIYTEMDKMKKAEELADLMIHQYPDHELTQKILKNRNIKYVRKDEVTTGNAEVYYVSLYGMYQEERYPEVLQGTLDFNNKYSRETQLLPKVSFLEALCQAKTGKMDAYKSSLESIVKLYPKSTEAEKAKLYLKTLAEHNKDTSKTESVAVPVETPKELYKYQEGFHFIMIILSDRKQNSASFVELINGEMDKAFPNQRIRGSNSYLDSKTPLLLIKRFPNIEEAKNGMNLLTNSSDATIKATLASAKILLISQDNFKELFTSKKLEDYILFYQENYK